MKPIRTIGIDAPAEWLAAHGFAAVPLPLHEGPTPKADAVLDPRRVNACQSTDHYVS